SVREREKGGQARAERERGPSGKRKGEPRNEDRRQDQRLDRGERDPRGGRDPAGDQGEEERRRQRPCRAAAALSGEEPDRDRGEEVIEALERMRKAVRQIVRGAARVRVGDSGDGEEGE